MKTKSLIQNIGETQEVEDEIRALFPESLE
jgi:hypothetical protein